MINLKFKSTELESHLNNRANYWETKAEMMESAIIKSPVDSADAAAARAKARKFRLIASHLPHMDVHIDLNDCREFELL